ncbi:cytochrome b561 and DOMON domain-containing protein At3g07570-like [Typha angustifolia]|uniref:cytochrome b561 and DOMON domain-containing protein At3g07570-like n=1 Tax=Typha angustifolia TaxID=59011 RepID=UPI003C2C55F4
MEVSLIPLLFLSFLSFFSSLTVNSQQPDSCSTKLINVTNLPFNTSNFHCLLAWRKEDFILRYMNTGPGLWSYVVSAPDTGSYIGIGFSRRGRMVRSSAVVGWVTPAGPAVVKQYYLGGKSSDECLPDQGNLKLVNDTIKFISQASRLYLAFQIYVDWPEAHLIYSVGPQGFRPSSPGYYLVEHREAATASIDYTTGVASDAGGLSGLQPERRHGLLVLLGWGFLIPIGVMAARYFKQYDPQWFYSHIFIQGIGFGLGLAGIILGFKLDDQGLKDVGAHKALGITIMVLGFLQVMALFARPQKISKVRKYWNWYHHYFGRSAIICAIANIFLGLKIAKEDNPWKITYGVFLAILVIVSTFLEIRKCMKNA